jgi:ribosome-binding protein aMBF1 (putative translation factor)
MTAQHSSYEELTAQRRDSDQYREGYAEARRAFLIGQAVRERRLALELSQVQLAARADMTQSALSRLEAGGVVPTIPLLERISAALDADLIVEIAPHAA